MYWIKQFFRLIALILITYVIGTLSFRGYVWVSSAEPITAHSDNDTRSTVHWLSETKPLTYKYNPLRIFSVRVLSNAIFSEGFILDRPINYAIEYAFLDDNGNTLQTLRYHHAAKLALNEEQQQVKQLIEDKKALSVSSGQSFYIDRKMLINATQLTLKLIPEESGLKGVVVRVHGQAPSEFDDPDRAWLRLPEAWRDRNMNYHTISPNAVSAEELRNAVEFDWQKLAPQGVPNIDYAADTLYESLPYNVLNYDFNATQFDQDSFYTDANLSASFRVYQQGKLTLRTQASLTSLNITWYDFNHLEQPKKLSAFKKVEDSEDEYVIENITPGLIVIRSSLSALTRWLDNQNQPISALHSYFYQVAPQFNANYQVTEQADLAIELRGATGTHVELNIKNRSGTIIDTQTYVLQGATSQFDRIIASDTTRHLVSDSEKIYLSMPKGASSLTISASEQVGVKLQSRQSNFKYRNLICERLCKGIDNHFQEIGAWFIQKALNDYQFSSQLKILKVRLFEPPTLSTIKNTHYYSRRLQTLAPVSNTALVFQPKTYFDTEHDFEAFKYRTIHSDDLITVPIDPTQIPDVIRIQPSAPKFVEQSLLDWQNNELENTPVEAKHLFINAGKTRPWSKTRLHLVKKNQTLTLGYKEYEEQPLSVVLKAFSQDGQDSIRLNTHIQAEFKAGVSTQYTIQNKHYALVKAELAKSLLLHPSKTKLESYPTITLNIGNDIKHLEYIQLTFEQDTWLTVIEEFTTKQNQLKWWQNAI